MLSSKETGEKIRTFRKSRHMSQADLAVAVGISCTYMSCVETGRKNASLTVLSTIAEQLGVTVDSLINEQEDTEDISRSITKIVADCTRYEAKILASVSAELIKVLRENRVLFCI